MIARFCLLYAKSFGFETSVNPCSVEAALGSHLNCETGKYVGLEGCLPTASQTLNLRYSESSSSGGVALVMLPVMGRETSLGPATAWSPAPESSAMCDLVPLMSQVSADLELWNSG
ncbi:hypothetical protein SRHO_G00289630 [Serrasalmus rhombeus]